MINPPAPAPPPEPPPEGEGATGGLANQRDGSDQLATSANQHIWSPASGQDEAGPPAFPSPWNTEWTEGSRVTFRITRTSRSDPEIRSLTASREEWEVSCIAEAGLPGAGVDFWTKRGWEATVAQPIRSGSSGSTISKHLGRGHPRPDQVCSTKFPKDPPGRLDRRRGRGNGRGCYLQLGLPRLRKRRYHQGGKDENVGGGVAQQRQWRLRYE